MQHRILIAGGGTGGHFFSGLAIASKWLELHADGAVILVGTSRGIEARTVIDDARYSKYMIASRGFMGKGAFDKLVALLWMAFGVIQSLRILFLERPQLVVGVGGYASAPTLVAAILLRVFLPHRIWLIEQNSHVGVVNRLLRRFVHRAFTGFSAPGFESVQLPIRNEEAYKNVAAPRDPRQKVLILGGSQGAKGLNNAWLQSLKDLGELRNHFSYLHQTGPHDEARVREAYQEMGLRAEVFAFVADPVSVYRESDLIVCRAGAMTIFEVTATKRPCVLVPFPHAAEDHQTKNALAVQKRDFVISENELCAERLAKILQGEVPALVSVSSRRLEYDLRALG